jgi:hypothetical protein
LLTISPGLARKAIDAPKAITPFGYNGDGIACRVTCSFTPITV